MVSVEKVNFSDTFQDDADWEEFRESLERDEDLKLLIPRCEKPFTALQYENYCMILEMRVILRTGSIFQIVSSTI